VFSSDHRLTADKLNIDRTKYSIALVPPVSSEECQESGRDEARSPAPLRYVLGDPIYIKWTAPAGHSRKDWIGLYRVIDVDDREVTKIASRGHWMPVCRAEYDDGRSAAIVDSVEDDSGAQGEVMFMGDSLVWKCGVYEARYHHDGYPPPSILVDERKHNVMAISRKFEIYVPKVQGSSEQEIERHLTPFVRNCFPPDDVPRNLDDPFILGKDREKETISKRIVYGIREMYVHSGPL
jgi:phosphatidylethanolamine N-methyltransferase